MERFPISPHGFPHLTPRQQQVVMLIAEDLSAKEIGKRVGISAKTAEYHRDLIKRRLGVAGTAGIVRYAIKSGLIEP
jgi:DNA-binding CsgD family transcriptional regulator